MSTLNTVDRLADSYNDKAWNNFLVFFNCVNVEGDDFKEIPEDIARVIVGTIGKTQSKDWINKPLERLDNQKVIDLVKSEKGKRALKIFLLSMRV